MSEVTYISTKECATLMRQALKAAFKGTKFSVRKGTGTGSSWISVSWVDGPTDSEVSKVVETYAGSRFNANNDDSYSTKDDVLLSRNPNELPELVHFCCVGVNTHREVSEQAEDLVTSDILKALDGQEVTAANWNGLEVNGATIRHAHDFRQAIHQVFYQTDFSKGASV